MLKVYCWILLCPLLGVLSEMLGCSAPTMDEKEAQRVLTDFYNDNVPESINDRHLLKAGKAIVPYLIKEIQREDMPKRGYAILALGKIGDRRALPVLLRMYFQNPAPRDAHPSDILRAIWHIDRELGEGLAHDYTGNDELMNSTIDMLRRGLL